VLGWYTTGSGTVATQADKPIPAAARRAAFVRIAETGFMTISLGIVSWIPEPRSDAGSDRHGVE
jgi:hypothetical protein